MDNPDNNNSDNSGEDQNDQNPLGPTEEERWVGPQRGDLNTTPTYEPPEWRRQENEAEAASAWEAEEEARERARMASPEASGSTGAAGGSNFRTWDHGHRDVVTTIAYNFHGDQIATGSADHRMKVFEKENDTWKVVDTWRAHSAQVFEVKWVSPQIGVALGSLGDDGKFKVWEEDVSAPLNSGRRYRCVCTLKSQSNMPLASFDFKHIRNTETYLTLLTRDGLLSVWEAVEYDFLHDWKLVDSHFVCTPPGRGTETTFKVHVESAELPCWTALAAGLSEKAFGIVTAAMNTVKIWRLNGDRCLYTAVEFPLHNGLVRDAAWANGAAWPYDLIATACKDGYVRVFKMTTPEHSNDPSGSNMDQAASSLEQESEPASTSSSHRSPSGIGAGLASAGSTASHSQLGPTPPGPVMHHVEELAAFGREYGQAWQLKWFHLSNALMSSHEDGSLHTWKPDVDDVWTEHSAIDSS
ncbi:MAG: epoxide hydrolase, soluble (sEH) [Sclerophora amabilis]|nr:MAG: epoxide hydrolase, soluble (sEH) [Sclerophora amabilis]